MTLPLFTNILIKEGHGEQAIGKIYAINTLGALAGIFFAVHIGLPRLGLQNLISAGAAIDIALGITLIWLAASERRTAKALAALVTGTACVAIFSLYTDIDHRKTSAGVFRFGKATLPEYSEVIYHRDGKTASIDVVRTGEGVKFITTNGKSDAAINMSAQGGPASDEPTMVLLGALPLSIFPEAANAATIGMGSGLTSTVLLGSPNIESLDVIEIEASVFDASREFLPRVEPVYTDPRSHLHVADAKAFFATSPKQYDLIISEPSNPWVSGISSLFSDEFYRRIRSHLSEQGLFVQWIQLYEIDTQLVASIIKAISGNFSDYAIYMTHDSDMVVIASPLARIGKPKEDIFSMPEIARELAYVDIRNLQDLGARYFGNKQTIDMFFNIFSAPTNSDYFPYVDIHAPVARFRKDSPGEISALHKHPLPYLGLLGEGKSDALTDITGSGHFEPSRVANAAMRIRDALLERGVVYGSSERQSSKALDQALELITITAGACPEKLNLEVWVHSLELLTDIVMPMLSPGELGEIWGAFERHACFARLPGKTQSWLHLQDMINQRNGAEMYARAKAMLAADTYGDDNTRKTRLLATAMLGAIMNTDNAAATELWNTYATSELLNGYQGIYLTYIAALAGERQMAHEPAGERPQP